jgi:hypothetical protein
MTKTRFSLKIRSLLSGRGKRESLSTARSIWILAPACAYSDELRQPRQGDRQNAFRTLVGQFGVAVVDLDDDLALASLVPPLVEADEVIGAGHDRVLATCHAHGLLAGLPESAVLVVEAGRDDERDRGDVVAVVVVDARAVAGVAAGARHVGVVGYRRVVGAQNVAERALEEPGQVGACHELAGRCRREQLRILVGKFAVVLGLLRTCRLGDLRGRRGSASAGLLGCSAGY